MEVTVKNRWVMAGAMGLLGYVVWGIGFYTMPVFYVPLEMEFGWTRTQVTSMGVLTIFTYSLSGPVVGALIDRLGVRRVVIVGVVLFGLSLALFAIAPGAIGSVYLIGGANGIACACVSLLPSQVLVSSWFETNRAIAMGFILTLMALGGVINSALAGNLIERLGWRRTAIVFDLMVWAFALPLSITALRNRPKPVQAPVGQGEAIGHADGSTLADAVRSPQLYLLCCGVFFNMAVGNALLQNIVLYVNDLGHGLQFGAFVMSGVVIANLSARLIIGVISDRASQKLGIVFSYACLGSSVLVFMSASGKLPLMIAGLLAGFGYGGSILMIAVIASTIFGTRDLGKILGILLFSLGVGSACGTLLVGRLFDATRSYHAAFLLLLVFAVASIIAIWPVRLQPARKMASDGSVKPGVFRFAAEKRE